jgi:hypothetical protein
MAPSPTEVGNFQQLLTGLSAAAVIAVTTLWNKLQNADPETRWRALQDAYPTTFDPFLAAAAVLSAEWYASINKESNFAVETAAPISQDVLHANVGWALSQSDPIANLAGSVERQVFNSSRDTVLSNARRQGVSYARYASANACSFCQILATRTTSGLYQTERSSVRVVGRAGRPRGKRKIGEKFHDNCHCVPVPVFDGELYTPPDYVEQWERQYSDAREDVGGETNDIINHMRRAQYDDKKDVFNAERRKRYAENKAAEQFGKQATQT